MSKKPDNSAEVTSEGIHAAIAAGKSLMQEGKPKIDAAMSIYIALLGQPQETVVSAFIEGAALTPKGAVTYWYNCRRKHSRMKPSSAQ